MAHKYSTFDSAFADFEQPFATTKMYLAWSATLAQDAWDEAQDPVDRSSFRDAVFALQMVITSLQNIGDFTESAADQSHFYEAMYWANKDVEAGEEYELTWQKICEAWAANDFEGRAVTIAFIDRMRQILWDEPFDARWAARPKLDEG